jgi:hypothetical protein
VGDTPAQGPSGGLSGAGYLQEVSPARQTPPVRSQSARALVAGDADGLLPADSLLPADEHPPAARAPSTTVDMSQRFIFVCYPFVTVRKTFPGWAFKPDAVDIGLGGVSPRHCPEGCPQAGSRSYRTATHRRGLSDVSVGKETREVAFESFDEYGTGRARRSGVRQGTRTRIRVPGPDANEVRATVGSMT